jgi:hypothetical protein
LAVVAADLAVDFAAPAVFAAPDLALLRVLAALDLACVAVLAAPLRALVAVDLAPLRAAAFVARAPVLRELEPVRVPPDRDEEDEDERPDDERLAGGIRKLLLLIDEGALAGLYVTRLRRIYPMSAQHAHDGRNVSAYKWVPPGSTSSSSSAFCACRRFSA